jgi:hypothetical protein
MKVVTVMAYFYMEHFKELILSGAPQKPTYWHRYVNATFVVWPHGKEELQKLLITPTTSILHVRTKEGNSPLFLNLLVNRKPNNLLGFYLHVSSSSPITCHRNVLFSPQSLDAARTCDPECLNGKIQHLKNSFKQNG